MKADDYEIGKHYIFINRESSKYVVSRLIDVVKGEFKEGQLRLYSDGDKFLYKAVGNGLWSEICEIPEHILKEINFIATSAILK